MIKMQKYDVNIWLIPVNHGAAHTFVSLQTKYVQGWVFATELTEINLYIQNKAQSNLIKNDASRV